jgi:Chalcone isomerase-like
MPLIFIKAPGLIMKAPSLIARACFWCAAALSMTEVRAREVAGVTMPAAVSGAGVNLQLNGMGVRREKVFFKAYVIALYLKKPTTDAQAAIRTNDAKSIVMTMLRDIGREMFIRAVESGISRNSGPVMPILRARLDLLEQALPDLRKGDVLELTWVPDTGTLVRGQGKTMTIPGKDFADALFAVWLGPNPVEVALKRALLGGE